METARLPYTQRNVLAASASLLLTASYWWWLHALNAEVSAHNQQGYEGEAAFIVVIPLLFLLLYAGTWSLVLVGPALRRGSEPIPDSQLLLGLLPTGLVLLLRLAAAI